MYPLIRKHEGRVVKRIGDGVMLAFSNSGRQGVVDACNFAVELQKELKLLREKGEIAWQLRVGIHAGEVTVEEDGDLLGDAVNVS